LDDNLIKKENLIVANTSENKEIHEENIYLNTKQCTLQASEEPIDIIEENLPSYNKQDVYISMENLEKRKNHTIKSENKIENKKDRNGELDLDYLDIPAFLRKQAD